MAKTSAPSRLLGSLIFVSGFIFSLALLEGGLRAFAYLRTPPAAEIEGTFRTICIGGSHTEGLGADPKHSYCAELQNILVREGQPGVRTYNLGRGGWNSHQIREQLPQIIETYRPQLVVAMIGEPNTWNYNGLGEYLAEKKKRTVMQRAADQVLNLRIFRLVRLLSEKKSSEPATEPTSSLEHALRHLTANNAAYTLPARRDALEAIFHSQGGKGPRAATAAVELSRVAASSGTMPQETLRWLLSAFQATNHQFQYSLMVTARDLSEKSLSTAEKALKQKLLRDLERALANERLPPLAREVLFGKKKYQSLQLCFAAPTCRPHLKHIVDMEPENVALRTAIIFLFYKEKDYQSLTDISVNWLRWNPMNANEAAIGNIVKLRQKIFLIPSQQKNVARINQTILATIAEIPALRVRFEYANSEALVLGWAGHDIAAIAAYLREKNIPLIIQTFPPERKPSLNRRPIDAVVLKSCDAGECVLSDTWSAFSHLSGKLSQAELKKIFSNKFGDTDAHLNEVGHSMIARKLAQDVLPFIRKEAKIR